MSWQALLQNHWHKSQLANSSNFPYWRKLNYHHNYQHPASASLYPREPALLLPGEPALLLPAERLPALPALLPWPALIGEASLGDAPPGEAMASAIVLLERSNTLHILTLKNIDDARSIGWCHWNELQGNIWTQNYQIEWWAVVWHSSGMR